MIKEQRVEQLTLVFAKALKSLEEGKIDDCMLVPFHSSERVEVIVTTSSGEKTKTIVNAPF